MGGTNGRHPTWHDQFAPSALLEVDLPPDSAEDGYPWALQRWDSKRKRWTWVTVGVVPLCRTEADLAKDAKQHHVKKAARYVWVRHWTPERTPHARGWRACLDARKTIGPVRP